MQQISLILDLLLAFMQSKNGFVGLQHVPGWTEIYKLTLFKHSVLLGVTPIPKPIQGSGMQAKTS